ncbi:hypothetical protein N431DRAFT_244503 [Stipitochalara longipes BDJ]|nr:hypothetical protein N431DRAFT_244503 [Stipitochalara longipes BDJ]
MNSLTSLLILSSFLFSPVLAAGNPATFWSDYPTCEDNCHQSVWAASSCSLANTCACSGCLCLADSCLCETSSWLTAVAQCIGAQCGSSGVVNAASIAASACAGNGYPLAVPSASLVSIGLAALPAATTQATVQASSVISLASSAGGGTLVQSVTSTARTIVTSTAIQTSARAGATTPALSTAVVAGASGTTSPPSSASPSVATSSGLSSGAKAGIGIGAALVAVIIGSLLAFIFYQRRRNSKAGQAGAEGGAASTGISELGGAARPFPTEKKNPPAAQDATRVSELHGGAETTGKPPVSPATVAAFPEKSGMRHNVGIAEMESAAPLSVDEKRELERRRRAAELSGERDIDVEAAEGERSELEARRRVYELA